MPVPICFEFERAMAPGHFLLWGNCKPLMGHFKQCNDQGAWGMEAIAVVASVKYQA